MIKALRNAAVFLTVLLTVSVIFFASELYAQTGRYIASTTSFSEDPEVSNEGIHRLSFNFKVAKSELGFGLKEIKGTANLSNTDGSGKRVQGTLTGAIDKSGDVRLTMKFIDKKGKPRSYKLEVEYDADSNQYLIRVPRKFGDFQDTSAETNSPKQPTNSANDISGHYSFSAAGPMTIVKLKDGSFQGTYSGLASIGHGDLRGVLIGTLKNGTWGGTITIHELSVVVNGTFFLNYNASPPATLIGSLFTPAEYNVSLTKQ